MIRNNSSSKSAFLFFVVVLVVAGCGGSSSNDQPGSLPAATITISGVVADGSVSNASVAVLNSDGAQIGGATADADGQFATEVRESELEEGYLVRVSGGVIGDSSLVGELSAIYGPGESYDSANVTVVTTLISTLAELEDSGTLVERRDAVIQLLSDIGLFFADEWNFGKPANVDVLAMQADVALGGISSVMNALITDLRDAEVDAPNMAYFPAAHGGISSLSLGASDNVVSGFPGGFLSEPVILLGSADSPRYEFSVIDGPSGLEVDAEGNLSYAIPDFATGNSEISFTIQATNATTAKGRRLNGSIFVIVAEGFEIGTVGPDGGTLREPVNSVEIVVRQGSVDTEVNFSLLRGRNAAGNLVLEIRSTGAVGEIEVYLPDPEQLDRATGTTEEVTPAIAGEHGTILANSHNFPVDLWRQEWAWFYNESYRMGQQITTVHTGLRPHLQPYATWRAEARVASTLSCSAPLNFAEGLEGRIPVLFVHGYAPLSTLGGGEDTWGQFPARVGELGSGMGMFLPCEFRWVTNARFQVVAEDLRKAVERLVTRTGMQAHIIAHSFGGILARTYLQGLAESPIENYPRPVASLTTLGTPHSGIAGRNDSTMYGVVFPDGQDVNFWFNWARQMTAYQAGEPVFYARDEKVAFGLKEQEGFIAASISGSAELGGIHPFPENFPIQVLIGLNTDQVCTPGISCTYFAREGDGLITYSGQRFHPSLTENGVAALLDGDVYSSLQARITEYVLGTNADIQPGAVDVRLEPFWGFSHNGFNGARHLRLREAELVDCETVVSNEVIDNEIVETETGCDFHDGFRRVRLWLADTESQPVSSSYGDPNDTSTSNVQISIGEIDVGGGSSNIQMFASVVTQNGVPLNRLTAGNFALSETINGVRRDVSVTSVLETIPGKAIVIAIDRSGSMGPAYNDDIVAAKAAAKAFVLNMQPGDQAAVIDFAGDVVVRQGFTRDRALLESVLDSVEVGVWSGTAAYDAAYEALELAREVFGEKAVLLLTDGADLSSRRSIDELTSHASALGVPIYTIGLGVGAGSPEELALIQIANDSNAGSDGSGYYAAPTGDRLADLYSAISDLLSSIYRFSWQSTGLPGDSVSVEISVTYQTGIGIFTDSSTATYTVP